MKNWILITTLVPIILMFTACNSPEVSTNTTVPTELPSVSVALIDSGQNLGSARSASIGIGDLDSDGDLDAFVINGRQVSKVWLNDGKGSYTVTEQEIGRVRAAHGVALGDLDGDGDLDAFIANIGMANEVWLNNGEANFIDSNQNLGSVDSNSVFLKDLDNDGDLDAVVDNWPQENEIWVNDGVGIFTKSDQALGKAGDGTIALGDVDSDDDPDIFVDTGVTNELWLNNGTGIFNEAPNSSVSGGTLILGDLDGDDDLDVFVANATNGNAVWFNDGKGTFTDSGQNFGWNDNVISRPQPVALGDIDGDGDLDAFTVHHELGNRLWLNSGGYQEGSPGFFIDSELFLIAEMGLGISLGDVDGDGDIDAFFANWEEPGNQIWLNETLVTQQ